MRFFRQAFGAGQAQCLREPRQRPGQVAFLQQAALPEAACNRRQVAGNLGAAGGGLLA